MGGKGCCHVGDVDDNATLAHAGAYIAILLLFIQIYHDRWVDECLLLIHFRKASILFLGPGSKRISTVSFKIFCALGLCPCLPGPHDACSNARHRVQSYILTTTIHTIRSIGQSLSFGLVLFGMRGEKHVLNCQAFCSCLQLLKHLLKRLSC